VDAIGHLWVATNIGLARWDGSQWTTHNASTSPLPHDDVRAITIAPDGRTAFIGTAEGVVRLENGAWTPLLEHARVNDLALAPDGRLGVATSFGGIAVYDGESWTQHHLPHSDHNSATALAFGADGRIWVSNYRDGGISVFDGEQWKHFTEENSDLGTHTVRDIVVDSEGRTWFVPDWDIHTALRVEGDPPAIAKAKLSVLDGETWNPPEFAPLYDEPFSGQHLAKGEDGRLWLVTMRDDGLKIHSSATPGTISEITPYYSIPPIPTGGNNISTLWGVCVGEDWLIPKPQVLLSTDDSVWIGTSYGLYHLHVDGDVEPIPLPGPGQLPQKAVYYSGNPAVEHLLVYEFHPDRIRLIEVGTIKARYEYRPSVCDATSAPDLYSPQDVTEFIISENVEMCEGADLAGKFRPIAPPPIGERYTYWMSEEVPRLPHLHTPHPIESENEFHLGIRANQPEEDEHWLRVLAFPMSADITKVDDTPPTAEMVVGDWRLFLYDVSISHRPHIDFVLHDDALAPSLEEYLEAAGWQVTASVED
jgi:hypothetical protein